MDRATEPNKQLVLMVWVPAFSLIVAVHIQKSVNHTSPFKHYCYYSVHFQPATAFRGLVLRDIFSSQVGFTHITKNVHMAPHP